MIKPILPPCSVAGCKHVAGAIINNALLCGEHANAELERVLKEREIVSSIRARAGLARRLADELKEPKAVATLQEIADALDEDAKSLEANVVRLKAPMNGQ